MRWDLFDKCIRWAGSLTDEDARRDVALQTLEEIGDRDLSEREIKHRVRWRALNCIKATSRQPQLSGDSQIEFFEQTTAISQEAALMAKQERSRLCTAVGEEEIEFLEHSLFMSDTELSRETGETTANIRKRRSRLRRKLKEIM